MAADRLIDRLDASVRQIRGTSTSQVRDAKLCLVTGGSGISPSSAALLAAA